MLIETSIVIPCYNEGSNIPELCHRLESLCSKIENLEIILVNNGSIDESEKLLLNYTNGKKFFKVIHLEKNQGYGHGIIQGLKIAQGKYIGWTHADLQTDPNDIARAIEIIHNNPNKKILIKGSRSQRPLLDSILSLGMSVFESLLFQRIIYEVNAQPTIFSRELLKESSSIPTDFSIDLFFYTEALLDNYRVLKIKTQFPKRKHGTSKWNKGIGSVLRFILNTVKYSLLRRFQIK